MNKKTVKKMSKRHAVVIGIEPTLKGRLFLIFSCLTKKEFYIKEGFFTVLTI